MGLNAKNRRRILIFLIIPILTIIPYFTDDILLRVSASILLVIYVGFIIFLRDTGKVDPPEYEDELPLEDSHEKDMDTSSDTYETDEGEEFKIISPRKSIEVITAETFGTSERSAVRGEFFKPPDFKENFEKIISEEIPKDLNQDAQFAFALEKILTVIKEAFIAHTAVFFWYNKSKQKLTLEKYVSSSSEISEQKFDIEDDILSKIVQNEEPELLTSISPAAEVDVIRYYDKPQGIRSFVGVPLFYGKKLLGVVALDSKEGDAFGVETIYSLGRVVRVISIMISLFEDKFEDSHSELRLKALLQILGGNKKFETEPELFDTIVASVANLIPWDVFTLVYFNSGENLFKTVKIINRTSLKYAGTNVEVELQGTIVGKAIMSGIPVKIDDTSGSDFPRFQKNEDVSFDGSFLAVPLVFDDQNFGVLCFESLKKSIYNNEDVQFTRNATKIFAYILYTYSNQSILKSLLSVDVQTLTLNGRSFLERLNIDLVKASELGVPGAVALIHIDDLLEQESLFEGDPFTKVLKSIADMIKDEMTPMNLIGRLNEKVFGVYFFNSSAKDVFLWAEKLRIKIARKPIAVVVKQSTFTVSIGVASTNNKLSAEEVIQNARLALNKALEKGGNTVKSIN